MAEKKEETKLPENFVPVPGMLYRFTGSDVLNSSIIQSVCYDEEAQRLEIRIEFDIVTNNTIVRQPGCWRPHIEYAQRQAILARSLI